MNVIRRQQPAPFVSCPRSRCVPLFRVQASISNTTSALKLRKATSNDVPIIRKRLLQEKMNPLSIKPENFTVVESGDGELIAFAQLEQVAEQQGKPVFEFRSLVVTPSYRGQGVGSLLLQSVVRNCQHDVYLTTLAKTTPFYERAGFRLLQTDQIPRFLWFEFAAGTFVARLAVNDRLVVMHRPRQQQ